MGNMGINMKYFHLLPFIFLGINEVEWLHASNENAMFLFANTLFPYCCLTLASSPTWLLDLKFMNMFG